MTKKSSKHFGKYLKEYFTVFLPKQKNCSPHTIKAGMQIWNMLLKYVCTSRNKHPEALSFEDFNRATVIGFLDEMEETRGWSASTRNQRLSCIRSFFNYAAAYEPLLLLYMDGLKGIPKKKSPDKSRTREYMSLEVVSVILRQPDTSTKMGIRDIFFLTLLFDSAMRIGEMLSLRIGDIDPEKKIVKILGKGSRERTTPINERTAWHFRSYVKLFHASNDSMSYLFYTTRDGVKKAMHENTAAKFIRKYGNLARIQCADVPEKIHSHMFRRTRALQMYRDGMPLEILADWLGHQNPETTLKSYVFADVERKRNALEKAGANTSIDSELNVGMWVGNESIINKLLGRG